MYDLIKAYTAHSSDPKTDVKGSLLFITSFHFQLVHYQLQTSSDDLRLFVGVLHHALCYIHRVVPNYFLLSWSQIEHI